jgi:membrane protein DedA with SNARE-associated domain/membrane-associated phospholipid phosphatase
MIDGAEGGTPRRTRILQLAAVLVIVGVIVAVSQLAPDISLQSALDDVASKLGKLTYLFVGLAAFLETGAFVGLVLPGETVVILGGAVAGQGETSVVLTIGIVWVCSFSGDSVSFVLGRRLGRGFILRHGPKVRITEERFARVEAYFDRHGGKTILIGRFIGLVRALAPFTAGTSGMRYTDYLPFSVLGTGLWAAGYVLLGYFASRSLDAAAHVAGQGTLFFGIAIAVIVAIVWSVRFLRDAENRQRLVAGMERRPVLRPVLALGRALQPHARFVAARLTPGGLGLEFTTLLAILAVAVYVVVAYTITISGDPGPTPGDQTALDLVDKLQTAWLVDVAKVVTALGSSAVILPIAGIATALLLLKRRWTEAAVLVVAVAIVYAGVGELKGLTSRPRPPEPLTSVSGSGFPSGHAAHSILYPWLALTLAIRLRPGMWGGTALLVTGFAIAILTGLSRLYLRVHYMSDVTSGWALGAAAFCGCAVVAMVVTHLRHNSDRDVVPGDRV